MMLKRLLNRSTASSAVAPSQRARTQIVANGLNWNPQVEGVTPDYLIARDWEISSADACSTKPKNAKRAASSCWAPRSLTELFPNMEPVGQTVRMNGGTFEVIGVLESKGQSGFGMDQDDIVLAPLTTVKRRISGRRGRGDSVSQISVKAASEDALTTMQEDVENLLPSASPHARGRG